MQAQASTYIPYTILNNHPDGYIRTGKEQIVSHVLQHHNVGVPKQINPSDIQDLSSKIVAKQEEVAGRSRKVEVLKAKVAHEKASKAQHNRLLTAVKVAFLVLAYGVLAITVIGKV